MNPALLVALQLVALQAQVEVETSHPVVELDGRRYLYVAEGEQLVARVSRSARSERLSVDIVRVGPTTDPTEGIAALQVWVGEARQQVRARPPLEASRKLADERLASYPVRHRFPLPSASNRVQIDVQEGAVLLALYGTESLSRAVSPVPLAPVNERAARGRLPLADPAPSAMGAAASEAEDTSAEDTSAEDTNAASSDAPPARGAPTSDRAAPEPSSPAPLSPTDAPSSPLGPSGGSSPPLDAAGGALSPAVEPQAEPPPATDLPADAPAEDAPWPVRLSAQVAVGGALQALGLQPAVLSGGVRLLAGAREGLLGRFAFGLGADFVQQAASARALPIRWHATETRLRLEAEARVLEVGLGFTDVDVRALGGLGVSVGGHDLAVGSRREARWLFGPAARLGVSVGARLGPGALVATLPLDVSVDTAGGTSGFAPVAAGLFVGYRLDL